MLGSQSIACVWLPPVTRSTLGGSPGSESASEPPRPTVTTKSSPQPDEQALTSFTPELLVTLPICSSLMAPATVELALTVRCSTSGNVALHGLLFRVVHAWLVPSITTVLSRCSQLSFTVLTPPPGGIETFAAVQRFAEGLQVRGYVVVPALVVTTALTLTASTN